jgi:EmrB/QacA subfamily drug resistance transporter
MIGNEAGVERPDRIGREGAAAPSSTASGTAPLSLGQGHPRKWLILLTVSLGMMLGVFNIALVNIAVPALVRDLGSTVGGVSWVLNAFNITQGVLLLSFGRLADRYGQRRIFLISLAVFTLFSLACGFAQNVEQLIIFRIFQGIGSAGMVPVSLVILLGAFPRRQHGLATGLWGALGQAAAILGPPVGGLLIGYASWHWIFFMNVPLGVIAVVTGFLFVPEMRRDAESPGLDLPGIGLSAATLFCLTLAIIQGNTWGWRSVEVLALLAGFVVLLAAFLVWEYRSRSPMLNLRLFRIRPFSAASGMSLIGGVGMAAGLMQILLMINLLGFNETKAALVMIPASCLTLVLSPFAGRLVDLFGPRYLGAIGAVFFVAGFALFSTLRADATVGALVWRTLFIGFAMAVSMPALTAAGLGSLPLRSSGVGSGMISTGRQVGHVIGLALLLAIYGHAAVAATDTTVTRATAYVATREDLSPALREEIVRLVERNAEETGKAEAAAGGFFDPAAGLDDTLAGRVDAGTVASLEAGFSTIAKDESGRAYMWPFLMGALVELLALPLAFLLGRRLGDLRTDTGALDGNDTDTDDLDTTDRNPDDQAPQTRAREVVRHEQRA